MGDGGYTRQQCWDSGMAEVAKLFAVAMRFRIWDFSLLVFGLALIQHFPTIRQLLPFGKWVSVLGWPRQAGSLRFAV